MMNKLPIKISKYITNKLVNEPLLKKQELVYYLEAMNDELTSYWALHFPKRESMNDELIDLMNRNSQMYEQLCTYLMNKLSTNVNSCNKIYDYYGCVYVEPLIEVNTVILTNIDCYTSIINKWFCNAKKYATQYEQFCALFLQDYGFDEVTLTKRNGDAGVDIICLKNGEDNFQLYTLHALCQVKFYKVKADQAIIRNIIGDSTLIAFDRATYEVINHAPKRLIIISHNGFNEQAEKYATAHGVTLLDTAKILRWIVKQPHYEQFPCIHFLEQFHAVAS